MLQNILITVLISIFSGAFSLVFGQTGGIKPTVALGDVTAIADKKITINSKSGPLDIAVIDKTIFKRAPAESLKLSDTTPGALTEISVGDRVTVSGVLASDGKSMPANIILYVTKADIAAKNAKEAAEWRTRGIAGKVTAVTPAGQVNVEVRNLTGSTNLVLTPKGDAKFVRYAPDSERFDEAKPSSLAEIKAGDMIRAIGDKSSDGTAFTAETVLTGAFQTLAGTVVSVDTAKNEVVIKNLQTKKDVTVVVGDTSILKKFPAEMAERMAGAQAFGGGGTNAGPRPVAPGGTAQPPAGGGEGQPGGQGRGGFGGRGGAGGIDDMLERFENIKPADLKVGDMIAVSSTKTGNMDRIRAIKLLSGVEPFLRMAQAGGKRQGQGQGVDGGFAIPGLDSIGFP